MAEDTPKPKTPQTEAQKRAKAKYYAANKDRWANGYNHSEATKEAKARYDAKRESRAEYYREYRKRKKESQNKG
jgi:hypothetical protein